MFHEDSDPSTEADRGREPVLRKERGGPGRSIDLLHGIDCPETTKHIYRWVLNWVCLDTCMKMSGMQMQSICDLMYLAS